MIFLPPFSKLTLKLTLISTLKLTLILTLKSTLILTLKILDQDVVGLEEAYDGGAAAHMLAAVRCLALSDAWQRQMSRA